jgi:polar amino acid transport system substrate-binding protein
MNRLNLLACILLAAAGRAGAAELPRLTIATELTPPSSMLDGGKLTGFATEKLKVVFQRSGIDASFAHSPWKRAYVLASTQPDTCVYSTTRLPEREKLFKWVGPTHENDWTLFAMADRHLKLASIDDARNLRIGTYSGDVRSEFLIARGYTVDAVQNGEVNPLKLSVGRIDLWATSLRVGQATAARQGFAGKIVPVLTFKRTELYLACNLSVSDKLIHAMNTSLQAINKDGTAKAIEQQFDFVPPPAQQSR